MLRDQLIAHNLQQEQCKRDPPNNHPPSTFFSLPAELVFFSLPAEPIRSLVVEEFNLEPPKPPQNPLNPPNPPKINPTNASRLPSA